MKHEIFVKLIVKSIFHDRSAFVPIIPKFAIIVSRFVRVHANIERSDRNFRKYSINTGRGGLIVRKRWKKGLGRLTGSSATGLGFGSLPRCGTVIHVASAITGAIQENSERSIKEKSTDRAVERARPIDMKLELASFERSGARLHSTSRSFPRVIRTSFVRYPVTGALTSGWFTVIPFASFFETNIQAE